MKPGPTAGAVLAASRGRVTLGGDEDAGVDEVAAHLSMLCPSMSSVVRPTTNP